MAESIVKALKLYFSGLDVEPTNPTNVTTDLVIDEFDNWRNPDQAVALFTCQSSVSVTAIAEAVRP